MSHTASLQNHNSSAYAKHASFVYNTANTSGVLGLLDAQPGERIIDLGCGTGQLTEIIRGLVGDGGSVVGVDSSSSMVSHQLHTAKLQCADTESSKAHAPRPAQETSLTSKRMSKSLIRPSTLL